MIARVVSLIDLPPVWTLGFVGVAAWLSTVSAPFGDDLRVPGAVIMLTGVLVMVWAVRHLRRAETTVMPGGEPSTLVRTGPYRYTRNPIYLGDAVILTGAAVFSGQPLGVLLVLPLAVVLQRRFIAPEERRLERSFGPAFRAWSAEIPRWI